MRTFVFTAALAFALPAAAQEQPDFVPGQDIAKETKEEDTNKRPEGWSFKLNLGFNFSLSHSSNVVGVEDGSTISVGGAVDGEANFKSGQHEVLNRLGLQHTQSKNPAIDEFVKTVDNLELRSMYMYSLESVPWLGPFARARLQTAVLEGEFISGDPATLAITDADGNVTMQSLQPQQAFDLTDPFEPLVLRQSAGAFARPINRKNLSLVVSAGLGAQEIVSQGGFAVADDEDTADVIEVVEIKDSVQAGAEIELDAGGNLNTLVSWNLTASVLYPFYTDADTELEGTDLVNTEVGAKLSAKLAEWVSLDYVLTAKRIPLVLDAWQVTNGVLLTSAFNLL